MFWFHVTGMWYFYRQRRREEFKKALEGALKFFSGIKIKPEQEFCFQGLVLSKEKNVLGVWKSLIWFYKTGTKKTISVFQISKFRFTTSCRLKSIVTVDENRAMYPCIQIADSTNAFKKLDFACCGYDSVRDLEFVRFLFQNFLAFEMS